MFCFRYSILELNTAVKPWMFAHLFARGYDRVLYIDPDVVIYSPLAEIDEAPPEMFLILTPHLTGFIDGDEHPSERTILQAGTYNLGFLCVSRRPSLERFLTWQYLVNRNYFYGIERRFPASPFWRRR